MIECGALQREKGCRVRSLASLVRYSNLLPPVYPLCMYKVQDFFPRRKASNCTFSLLSCLQYQKEPPSTLYLPIHPANHLPTLPTNKGPDRHHPLRNRLLLRKSIPLAPNRQRQEPPLPPKRRQRRRLRPRARLARQGRTHLLPAAASGRRGAHGEGHSGGKRSSH